MKQFSELTLEELHKKKASIKGVLIAFIVLAVIIALGFAYFFFFGKKSLSIPTLIPLLILPITWIPIFISIKSLNDEIDLRKSKMN